MDIYNTIVHITYTANYAYGCRCYETAPIRYELIHTAICLPKILEKMSSQIYDSTISKMHNVSPHSNFFTSLHEDKILFPRPCVQVFTLDWDACFTFSTIWYLVQILHLCWSNLSAYFTFFLSPYWANQQSTQIHYKDAWTQRFSIYSSLKPWQHISVNATTSGYHCLRFYEQLKRGWGRIFLSRQGWGTVDKWPQTFQLTIMRRSAK